MIETREQWDGIELWSVHIGWKLSDEEKQMVFETLEALREVARAARFLLFAQGSAEVGYDPMELIEAEERIRPLLKALPPWLLEEKP